MKRQRLFPFFLPSLFLLFFTFLNAQENVGIGTTTPHPSAILELQATNKGLLIPRLTQLERDAIVSPAQWLLIFNTTTQQFEYWDGLQWIPLMSGTTITTASWSLSGNALTGSEFLGSLNAQPVIIKTNNTEVLRITTSGNVGIHTSAPAYTLTIRGVGGSRGTFDVGDGNVALPSGTHYSIFGNRTADISQDIYNLTSNLEVDAPSNTARQYAAGYYNLNLLGSANYTGSLLFGVAGQTDHYGTGTVTNAYGVLGTVVNRVGGSITNARAFRARIANVGTGAIQTGVNFYVEQPAGSGPITNLIGLQIPEFTAGTNRSLILLGSTIPTGNYALYSGTSYPTYFQGNVGIGTLSPSVSLEVSGSARIATSAGTTVVIGDESPDGKLRVGGSVRAQGFRSSDGTAGTPAFRFVNSTSTGMFSPATNHLAFSTDGVERIRISNTGNIGIGTSSPLNPLHLSAATDPLRIEGLQSTSASTTLLSIAPSGVVYTTSANSIIGTTSWLLTGNNLTGSEFLGSLNAQPVIIKVNGAQVLQLNPNKSIQRDAGGNPRGPNAIDLQITRYANSAVASGEDAAILGGIHNTASGNMAVVAGGTENSATAEAASIGGGKTNSATGAYAHVGGGEGNLASSDYAVVAGGNGNQATNQSSGVLAGQGNIASGPQAAILGGTGNTASGAKAAVISGEENVASGFESVILGGEYNTIAGDFAIGGGVNMYLAASADRTFVWGYANSTTAITASDAFLIGPYGNTYRVGINLSNPAYALELPNNSSATVGQARAYAWVIYSDERIKSRISPIASALPLIQKTRPVRYFQHNSHTTNGYLVIDSSGTERYGFLAQELKDVIPEAVIPPQDESDLWGVDYTMLIPLLTAALQEQQKIIETQNARLKQLEESNQILQEKIEQLQTQIAQLSGSHSTGGISSSDLLQLIQQIQDQIEELQAQKQHSSGQ